MNTAQNRPPLVRGLLWTLRILLVFAVLASFLVILYRFGYRAYRENAQWVEEGNHDALIYEGETYYLAGKLGQKGLSKSKYPVDKLLGQVRDDGDPVTTEPVTTAEPETTEEPETEEPEDPEDTETEEETDPPVESVKPPVGAELFENEMHTYVFYSVEKKEDFLLVLERDGSFYVYYREGTENPVAPSK